MSSTGFFFSLLEFPSAGDNRDSRDSGTMDQGSLGYDGILIPHFLGTQFTIVGGGGFVCAEAEVYSFSTEACEGR